jgi:hypothetical protein
VSRSKLSGDLAAARLALLDIAGECCSHGAVLDTGQLQAFGPGAPEALDRLTTEVREGDQPSIEEAARAFAKAVTLRTEELPREGLDDPSLALFGAWLTLRGRLNRVDNIGADLEAAEKKAASEADHER